MLLHCSECTLHLRADDSTLKALTLSLHEINNAVSIDLVNIKK